MDTPVAPAQTPVLSKLKVFLRRLVSFLVLWTIVLVALFSSSRLVSDYIFLLVMMVLALTGLAEFYGLAAKRGLVCFERWGILGGVLLMVGTFLNLTGVIGTSGSPARVNDFETSFLILFVLGLCLRQFLARDNTTAIQAISTTLFGLMYVPWLLNFIQKINFFPRVEGHYYLLYFVLITKFSDTGAYAGRVPHRAAQDDSAHQPRKDLGGVCGGDCGLNLGEPDLCSFPGRPDGGHSWKHAVILGMILSVSAVVGDLIESIFKREAGVKDSGRFFPGIGGILDLLDSLLFNAPIMYLYLRHVLTR